MTPGQIIGLLALAAYLVAAWVMYSINKDLVKSLLWPIARFL